MVLPTPGRIEEGQALSACTLIDGTSSDHLSGRSERSLLRIKKKYDLIFEPNDPVLYAAKDTFHNPERNSCLFYECYRW